MQLINVQRKFATFDEVIFESAKQEDGGWLRIMCLVLVS
jgi:hypothetical protein